MNEYLQNSMNAYLQIICSELKGIKLAIQSLTPDLDKIKEEIESVNNIAFAKIMKRLTQLEER